MVDGVVDHAPRIFRPELMDRHAPVSPLFENESVPAIVFFHCDVCGLGLEVLRRLSGGSICGLDLRWILKVALG